LAAFFICGAKARNFDKKIKSTNTALQNPHAAMQTRQLSLASGIRKLIADDEAPRRGGLQQRIRSMSKTASLDLTTSTSFFARFMASLDRALMASARISARNGDLPRFGL
jgi:hypothetical protein